MVGRSSPDGPVDDLTLESGHWATQPGQVVLNDIRIGPSMGIGTQITVTGVPGSPHLTVVGFATSITDTALSCRFVTSAWRPVGSIVTRSG